MNFDQKKMTSYMAMQVGLQEPGEIIVSRKPNTLPSWGNATTMNLNPLIHTNIENSPYFNGRLSELKTYHELVDEIYYKVKHLEPWEKGSRNAGGRRQTGMCGGVRGVGVGGIISSAFCILYRLYAIKLTRKQVYGLLNHSDSPYIRGIGFLYVRFSQPPADFWDWFEQYIDDSEEVDVRAGGGQVMTMGEVVRHLITRQDWFSTLFPRIPVPIQIQIDKRLAALKHATSVDPTPKSSFSGGGDQGGYSGGSGGDYDRQESSRSYRDRDRERRDSPERDRRGGGGDSSPERDRKKGHSSSGRRRSRSRSPDERRRVKRSKSRSRSRSRTPKRKKEKKRSKERHRHRHDRH